MGLFKLPAFVSYYVLLFSIVEVGGCGTFFREYVECDMIVIPREYTQKLIKILKGSLCGRAFCLISYNDIY